MINLIEVSKKYKTTILDSVSYTFPDKGLFAIVGSSGSGKTTLLNIISGKERNYSGTVEIDGIEISHLPRLEQSKIRLSKIGYIFQDFKLINSLSIDDNILLPLSSSFSLNKRLENSLLKKAKKTVKLSIKGNKLISELSGGEKQRVAVARSIITRPSILLADEPTGNLDLKNSEVVFQILKEYSKDHLVILVTHDVESAKKIADTIIRIKDGKIRDEQECKDLVVAPSPEITLIQKRRISISPSFLFKVGYRKYKERKWRSLLTTFTVSLGLVGLGLSIIFSSSLKNQIVDTFSGIIKDNQIMVTRRNANPSTFSYYIGLPDETARNILADYKDYAYGLGTVYLNNFQDMFKDRDEVYLASSKKKYVIEDLSFMDFMEFKWAIEKEKTEYYPEYVPNLEYDEIVLGLTYQTMNSICFSLQIERNFSSLGLYLKNNEVIIGLGVTNKSWSYYDDQYLILRAVYESPKNEILHTENLFNEVLAETKMRLPSTNDFEDKSYPWLLYKTPSFHLSDSPTLFIEEISKNKKYKDVVFQRQDTYSNNNFCVLSDTCSQNVLLLFLADKNEISICDIESFMKIDPSITGYQCFSSGGYSSYSNGLVQGFSLPIYFSKSQEELDNISDVISVEHEGQIELPSTILSGDVTRSNNGGVLFNADYSELIDGRFPENLDEVVVSKKMLDYLGINKYKFEPMYYSRYSEALDEIVNSKFNIVGITDEDDYIIHNSSLFSISFFRDRLKIDSFSLMPTSASLNIDNKSHVDEVAKKLTSSFKQYIFENPLQEIGSTVDDVMKYVNVITISFTVISLLISFILLIVVSYLNAIESQNDIDLLKQIGFPKETIADFVSSHGLIMGLVAGLFSSFELILVQLFLSIFLANYIGTSINLSISIYAIFINLLISVLVPFFISRIIANAFSGK